MANTYNQVYIQAVFAVKYRRSLLHASWRQQVFGKMGQVINETGCKTLIVNGVEDHVHCFLSLKPAISISELMKTVKAKSSKFINDKKLTSSRFEWQRGYGVFSYNQSLVKTIYRYVENQERHHNRKSFRDEYLEYLSEYNIQYDEQYIFEALI